MPRSCCLQCGMYLYEQLNGVWNFTPVSHSVDYCFIKVAGTCFCGALCCLKHHHWAVCKACAKGVHMRSTKTAERSVIQGLNNSADCSFTWPGLGKLSLAIKWVPSWHALCTAFACLMGHAEKSPEWQLCAGQLLIDQHNCSSFTGQPLWLSQGHASNSHNAGER
jgi:hypothetical protein